jgi:pimeloyl-ACP methyl ester carboxylesterase
VTAAFDYAFLHGGGQGGWVWQETISALHRQTDGKFGRAVALDIPGCGCKRNRETSDLSVDDVVAELITDIDAAGLRDVVLVGHSQAGSILPAIAERRPRTISRLIYVACSAPLPGQNALQMMGSSRHGTNDDEVGFPLDPKIHRRQEQYPLMFCNDMNAEQARSFLGKLGNDMWPMPVTLAVHWRYGHLASLPSSFVMCLQDGVLPVRWQETFAQRLQAERVVRLDAGHQPMITNPHSLAEILRHEAEAQSVRHADTRTLPALTA